MGASYLIIWTNGSLSFSKNKTKADWWIAYCRLKQIFCVNITPPVFLGYTIHLLHIVITHISCSNHFLPHHQITVHIRLYPVRRRTRCRLRPQDWTGSEIPFVPFFYTNIKLHLGHMSIQQYSDEGAYFCGRPKWKPPKTIWESFIFHSWVYKKVNTLC